MEVKANDDTLNGQLTGFFSNIDLDDVTEVSVASTPGLSYENAQSLLDEDGSIGTIKVTDAAGNDVTYTIVFEGSVVEIPEGQE